MFDSPEPPEMSPQTNTRLNVSHTPSMFELGGLLVDIGGAFDGPWSPDEPDDLGALMLNDHLDPEALRSECAELVRRNPGHYLRLFGSLCFTVVHELGELECGSDEGCEL